MVYSPVILQFKKKVKHNRMYYLPSPFFYQMDGQLFVFPPMMPPNMIFPDGFEKNQANSQELSQQKKMPNSDAEVDSLQNKNLPTFLKSPELKQIKPTIDSDYEPQKNELLIFYKKKNTESNLSNQLYSFLSCKKSMRLMLKLFDGDVEKVEELYKLIKRIKKTNKKYMNRTYISQMIQLKEGTTNFKIYKRSKCPLDIQKVRKSLRIAYRYFLLNVCHIGLLTSKKMNKDTLMQHFSRKRQIMRYLTEGVTGNSENLQ